MTPSAPSFTDACLFPASASQRGLWLLDKLDGPNPAYNIPVTIRLEGALESDILRASFQDLAGRHDVLRTAICDVDGEPKQTVFDEIEVDFSELKIPSEEALLAKLLKESGESFLLGTAPLWRVRLFHLSESSHVIQTVLHHAIADGYSLMVLLRDLVEYYNSRLKNTQVELPELSIQFGDYACWEESNFRSLPEDTVAYWREKLADLPELKLPGGLQRPEKFTYAGRVLREDLEPKAVAHLEAYALDAGLSPFIVYLGILQIALQRWTGQADILLGVPLAARTRPELKDMVGFLTNTLVVRHPLDISKNFRAHCESLASDFKDDLEYSDIPFELLSREILDHRDASKNPFFQVMFAYQQEPDGLPDFCDAVASVMELPLEVAHFDLHVEVVCRNDCRQLNVEFASDIITSDSARELISIFHSAIEQFAENPLCIIQEAADTHLNEELSLSPHQERIWFIDTFETGNVYPGHPTYHNLPIIISGRNWDSKKVGMAAKLLLERHEALRAHVIMASDRPKLQIRDSVDVTLDVLNQGDASCEVSESVVDYIFKPFDPCRDLLFRIGLEKSKDGSGLLVIVSHHLVADRRSMEIIGGDFKRLYEGLIAGKSDIDLPAVATFQEALGDERKMQDSAFSEDLDYWKAELELPLAALELPADFARHPVHVYEQGRHSTTLDADLIGGLNELAVKNQCNFESVLFAAFQLLLSRYSGQDEIVVGLPEPAVCEVVAPLSNLLCCRERMSMDSTFTDHLLNVHGHIVELRKHGNISFDRLVKEINPPKDMSRTALFDVIFELTDQNPSVNDLNIGYGKYDMHAHFLHSENGLKLNLSYNSKLYRAHRLESMFQHFQVMLKSIVGNPEQSLGAIQLMLPEERQLQISVWNDTAAEYPVGATVHHLFEEQALAVPDNVAIRDEGQEFSYAEINRQANAVAKHLLGLDVHAEELVGICMDRSAECVVVMLGVLKAGAAYLPLDPGFPKARLQWILNDADVRIVIGEEALISKLDVPVAVGIKSINPDDCPEVNPEISVPASQLAYCIYTSGSSGKPKGVLVEHEQVVRLMVNDRSSFDFKSSDVWTFFHSPCFDFSVWEMYGALFFGGTLVVVPKCVAEDSAKFAELLIEEKITVLNQTPTSFYHLASEFLDRPREHHLHTVIFGGETLSPLRIREFHASYPGVKMVNMFGITETTVHVTYKELTATDFDSNLNLIGKPIATTTCYILDSLGNLQPAGIPGEIHVGGKGVARGYLNRPQLSEERFIANPFDSGARLYCSGDKAYALENGEVVHLGRLDAQIQIRGYRVETGEIQAQLLLHPNIRDVLITTQELKSDGTNILIAYVVLTQGAVVAEFAEFLADSLPGYMIPSRFIVIDEIPLTANGKADIANLPEVTSLVQEEEDTDEGPLFGEIGKIWKQLLGVEVIEKGDDFFKLGGYSLLATRMLALIEKKLGRSVPLRSLFDNSRLSDFVRQVEKSNPEGDDFTQLNEVEAPLVLSSTQKRLWFLDKLEKQSIAYHLFGIVKFDEQPEIGVLRQALQYVVDRHPALRTGFPEVDGEPRLRLSESISIGIDLEDLSALSSEQQNEEFEKLSKNYSREPFDLSQAPLLRARMYVLSEGQANLVIGLHHIIADGWSLSILFRDLQSAYQGFLENTISSEGSESLSYPASPDISSSEKRDLLSYWQAKLEGVESLCLPTDFPRPSVADTKGGQIKFTIDRKLLAKLTAFCDQTGHTPFMVCLGVFELLLSRKARQEQFAVGIPLANREGVDAQSAVGCFVNTLPAVAEVNEKKSFIDLLECVKDTTLDIQENQQLPFDQLVEALNPERDMGSHPLYQVLFNYQESLFRDSEHPVPDIEPIDTGASQVDLALYLDSQSAGEGLEALLVYRSSLFKRSSIKKIAEQFEQTLATCLEQADSRLESHAVLPATDSVLISKWNDTGKTWEGDLILHKLFETTGQDRPDQIAITIDEKTLSYRELDNCANQLAGRLLAEYALSGDSFTTAICFERSIEMVVSMLAVMKTGGAYLPLDPGSPADRILQMLRIAGTQRLITSRAFAEKMSNHSVEVCIYEIPEPVVDTAAPDVDISQHDPAYVIFTSGSTGEPKGVVNSHQAICNRLFWMRNYLSVDTQSDKILQKTPYTFDVSLWDIFLPLISGVELVLARPGGHMDPSYLVGEINHRKISVLHFVPSMLQVFLLHPNASSCKTLRHVVCSGEALSQSLVDAFYRILPNVTLHNLYGPTEAAVDVTAWECSPGNTEVSVPIGRPIDNLAIRIVDRFLRDVPIADQGEICIEGIGLADGYCNNDELTEAAFVRDPQSPERRMYRTGDLGCYRNDGAIEFHRRIDNQVKIRGLRVELDEIDHLLRSLPGILEAATVVPHGKDTLHAFVVVDTKDATKFSGDVIKASLSQKLPDYMVPSQVSQLESLPLSKHGKIDRGKLSHRVVENVVEQNDFQDEWEELVADVWRDLLGSETFGRTDNFFDAGGHSLLLIKVHLELEKRSGLHIELVDLFSHPTVATLADLLRDVSGEGKTVHATPAVGGGGDIAVIGMSGRFPGAATLGEFKTQILQGQTAIRIFTREELVDSGIDNTLLEHPDYVPAQGALDGVEFFDAGYFSFSPAEAMRLDPQARIFLTCAEEALQNAAIVPGDSDSTIGVFAGSGLSTYGMLQLTGKDTSLDPDVFSTVLANDKDYLATRTAYKLGLKGPALSIQTACSTSLAALHVACQSLLDGDCDTAIAGGVSIPAGLPPGYIYQQDGILSPDGHCRAFSKDAQGTVQGAGCGVVVLKPLELAMRDGDPVLAVIKGAAMNNDGDDKVGFTAPGVRGQQQVIQSALNKAGLEAKDISYIETHGTGTALGDMIEVSALKSVFSGGRKHQCVLGAVKSQIGHLDAAAGIAGLIKTVICLQEKKLPPTLYAESPNPTLGLEDSPFVLNPKAQEWPEEGKGRFAGVSSFGIGGTNVHVILQGADAREVKNLTNEPILIVLSAPTESSLKMRREWLIDVLDTNVHLPSLAWTLQTGRKQWPVQEAYIVSSAEDLVNQLAGAVIEEVEMAPEKKSLVEVRDSWLDGKQIEWKDLYTSQPPARIALPPFPFEYKKFWALDNHENSQSVEMGANLSAGSMVYEPFFRPVKLKALTNPGDAFLVVSAQTASRIPEQLVANPGVTVVDEIAFLDLGDPAIKPFDSAMLILDIPSSGISRSARLLRVQKLVSVACERNLKRFLIVDPKGSCQYCELWQKLLESYLIVLRQENPVLDISLLQVDTLDENSVEAAINILFTDTIPYPVLKQAGKTLLRPQYAPSELKGDDNSLLREGAKYLITGASGGIAPVLADYLATNYQGTLYLAARKPISSDLIEKLEQKGSAVQVINCDVTDLAAVREAMQNIPGIDGVFHLAGVSGEQALLDAGDVSEVQADQILAPKIEGTENVLHVAKTKGCKFFVGFSSLSTVLGGLGFSVYAAANAAMDALLEDSNLAGDVKCFSIAWDGWNLSGAPVSDQLESSAALQMMNDIVATGQSGRFIVAASSLDIRIQNWVFMKQGVSDSETSEAQIDSEESVLRELESIWQELLGVERIRQQDDFLSLGGDSLLAIQMLAMISKRLPTEINMRDIMEASNIEELASLLWGKRTTLQATREIGEI